MPVDEMVKQQSLSWPCATMRLLSWGPKWRGWWYLCIISWERTNKRTQLEEGPRAMAVVIWPFPMTLFSELPSCLLCPLLCLFQPTHVVSVTQDHTQSSINSSHTHGVPTKCPPLRLHRCIQYPSGPQGAHSTFLLCFYHSLWKEPWCSQHWTNK